MCVCLHGYLTCAHNKTNDQIVNVFLCFTPYLVRQLVNPGFSVLDQRPQHTDDVQVIVKVWNCALPQVWCDFEFSLDSITCPSAQHTDDVQVIANVWNCAWWRGVVWWCAFKFSLGLPVFGQRPQHTDDVQVILIVHQHWCDFEGHVLINGLHKMDNQWDLIRACVQLRCNCCKERREGVKTRRAIKG